MQVMMNWNLNKLIGSDGKKSNKSHYLEDGRDQQEVLKLISSWNIRVWESGGITRLSRKLLAYLDVYNMKFEAQMEERICERGIKNMIQEEDSSSAKETKQEAYHLVEVMNWNPKKFKAVDRKMSHCDASVLSLTNGAGIDEKQRFESGRANHVGKPGRFICVNA
ncbi:unnamed protein product [Microthlaspi erraticum]|uniref:Uncharacterized protein n=1 Tax=Microthlaspi erraticum TaxID=1685480 RepID=A0A6D2L474_9BRAS|nr:unnamed protein product [Microthlaspi erraticum]